MIERAANRFDLRPKRLAADTAYGSGGMLAWLMQRGIEPHIPVLDRTAQTNGDCGLSPGSAANPAALSNWARYSRTGRVMLAGSFQSSGVVASSAPRHARIGLDYARIRGESLAADQTGAKTGSKHVLERQAESANISCSCATSEARPPCMWKVRLPIPPPDVEKAGNSATQRGKNQAWVVGIDDPTVHISPDYFYMDRDQLVLTLQPRAADLIEFRAASPSRPRAPERRGGCRTSGRRAANFEV